MKTNQRVLQMVTIVALFIAVVFISVGFALMSTSLSISGQAKVIPAKWEVKFTAKEFKNNSTSAYVGDETGLVWDDTHFNGYEIVLTRPGDHGTYEVTVTNAGDLDAEVSSFTLGSSLTFTGTGATASADETICQTNVTYDVKWKDTGSAIANGDVLTHGTSRIITIDVVYKSDATALPTNPVTVTGRDLSITFRQK